MREIEKNERCKEKGMNKSERETEVLIRKPSGRKSL
jgi:hypothetical protein